MNYCIALFREPTTIQVPNQSSCNVHTTTMILKFENIHQVPYANTQCNQVAIHMKKSAGCLSATTIVALYEWIVTRGIKNCRRCFSMRQKTVQIKLSSHFHHTFFFLNKGIWKTHKDGCDIALISDHEYDLLTFHVPGLTIVC